ncbi:unnamed protein product [Adineta ricciae]|uniref:Uncharacterized protein n=2 Tax=Adineta ricciae TaxID=249248 RepID=A0A814VLF2_ADIRI|nr:unnamed protein product [Adineta ricciae]
MILLIGFLLLAYVAYQLYQHFNPAPNVDPKGKYVLISGCDTGFGNGLAIELDKQGYNVLAGVYSPDSVTTLTSQLSTKATVFQLDITKKESIESAYELVAAKTKTLHALVNNAGVSTGGHVDWITTESMRRIMDINFFGHVDMTKTFLPLLIARRGSRVINICSIAGFISPPSGSAYCASKYALESFSDCLRREMFSWGLHVSIIEPGIMRTAIVQKHTQAVRDVFTQWSPGAKERWGEEYCKSYLKKMAENPLLRNAEDPIKVVRALEHAVSSTVPCIRYKPGWQSKFVYYPLSLLPAWLADMYFVKTRVLDVAPVGMKNQF